MGEKSGLFDTLVFASKGGAIVNDHLGLRLNPHIFVENFLRGGHFGISTRPNDLESRYGLQYCPDTSILAMQERDRIDRWPSLQIELRKQGLLVEVPWYREIPFFRAPSTSDQGYVLALSRHLIERLGDESFGCRVLEEK